MAKTKKPPVDLVEKWTKDANDAIGKPTFERVRWMTDEECDAWGWSCRGVVIEFSGGLFMIISADDEGNGPGAIHTNIKKMPILPVLPRQG